MRFTSGCASNNESFTREPESGVSSSGTDVTWPRFFAGTPRGYSRATSSAAAAAVASGKESLSGPRNRRPVSPVEIYLLAASLLDVHTLSRDPYTRGQQRGDLFTELSMHFAVSRCGLARPRTVLLYTRRRETRRKNKTAASYTLRDTFHAL